MDNLQVLQQSVEKFILDPQYHDLLLLVKAVRNGIVYGAKVRFPHALVMVTLFRSGTIRQKALLILKATRQHARNLGLFALIYKSTMLFLNRLNQKEGQYDSFFAGLLGGYAVFGRGRSAQNSVKQQIVIYIFARVCLAYAKLLVQPRGAGKAPGGGGGWGLISDDRMREKVLKNAWPAFASLSWALVMYVFRWHPDVVQPSLKSSMTYIYVNSDYWDSFRNFLIHNT